jgi:cytochrome c
MHNATNRPDGARRARTAEPACLRGLSLGAVVAVIAVLASTAAPAWASPDLAAKKLCMGCHRIDERRNGPSLRDIAKRYAGQPDAVATLSRKVIQGGRGSWGMVPMPANPQVSEAEARQLVQWILTHR